MASLPKEERCLLIEQHRDWVKQQRAAGKMIRSGFLVDGEHCPGAGGLMMFEALSYEEALVWVKSDPMIRSARVHWQLHQWISVDDVGFENSDMLF